ncbi:MAG: hypothetical protein E4H36_04730 [Spirochaetales bacterium]|nr:MAG: hypothetical protein E4H36_04730 [Spirochaetales bacterium]
MRLERSVFTRSACIIITALLLFSAAFQTAAQDFQAVIKAVVQKGHASKVLCAAASPDGSFAASGDMDGTLILWEAKKGLEIGRLEGHQGPVHTLAFHPSSQFLLSGGEDGKLLLWDLKLLRVRAVLEGSADAVLSAAFSKDGNTVAAGGMDRAVRMWTVDTQTLPEEVTYLMPSAELPEFLRHTDAVTAVRFSEDEKNVLSAGRDGTIRIWDRRSGNLVRVVREVSGIAEDLAVMPEKSVLAGAFQDGTIGLYDKNGNVIRRIAAHSGAARAVAFSRNGTSLASGGADGFLKLWETETGRLIRSVPIRQEGITAVTWLPGTEFILTASAGGGLQVTDSRTGTEQKKIEAARTAIRSLAASDNGDRFAMGLEDGTILLWDLGTGRPVQSFSYRDLPVIGLDLSPDGSLAAGSYGNGIAVFNTFDGNLTGTFGGHSDLVETVAFLDEGKSLISGGRDYTARLWSLTDFSETAVLNPSLRARITSVQGSPFNSYVYTGSHYGLRMWDRNGTKELTLLGSRLEDIVASALHPRGTFAATLGRDEPVKIWDAFTGQVFASFGQEEEVRPPLVYSPDGGYVLTGSADNDLLLWDTAAEKPAGVYRGDGSSITAAVFLKQGELILAAFDDGTARLWSRETGTLLCVIRPLGGKDWAVTAADGRFDASRGAMEKFHFVLGISAFETGYAADSLYMPNLAAYLADGSLRQEPAGEKYAALRTLSPPPALSLDWAVSSDWEKTGLADIYVRVSDTGGGVSRVRLYRNGKLADESVPSADELAGRKDRIIRFLVPLLPGRNYFSASAASAGGTRTGTARLVIDWKGSGPERKLFALCLGLGTYNSLKTRADYPVMDATAFAETLESVPEAYYREKRIFSFTDKNVQKSDIIKALEAIAGEAGPGDLFLFYFAGNYASAGEEGYFLLYSAEGTEGRGSANGVLTFTELTAALKNISAGTQLLLVDSYNLREPPPGKIEIPAPEDSKTLTRLGMEAGINICAVTGSGLFTRELPQLGHGVFTSLVLETLSADSGSSLTMESFLDFMNRRIPMDSVTYLERYREPITYGTGYDAVLGAAGR